MSSRRGEVYIYDYTRQELAQMDYDTRMQIATEALDVRASEIIIDYIIEVKKVAKNYGLNEMETLELAQNYLGETYEF